MTNATTQTPPVVRYQVQSDEFVDATSATELVEYLARTSKIAVASTAAFRVRAAYYRRGLHNQTIRTYNDDVFVEDMIAAGAYHIVPLTPAD